MNKTILSILIVFLTVALFASFATAIKEPKVHPKKDLGCKCKSRSVLKCGLGKSDEAADCRKKYIESCRTRCTLLKKCSAKIQEKCSSKKQGSVDYKKCERTTAASYCVEEIDKSLIKDCKCKTFARALCGTSNGKEFVRCRDTAEDACRKKCGPKLPKSDKKRICISQSNCSCKKISRTKCAGSDNFKACYNSEVETCNKKCVASTQCFPLSCKNAGFKRCDKAVVHFCKKFETGTEEHIQCVTKETERCKAFEYATCKKARRLYRYRLECDSKSEKVCGKYAGAEKCSCISKAREACIADKIKHREIFIRHQKSCKTRAKLLCDEKKCDDVVKCYEEETRRCHRRCKRRHDIVPPECTEKVRQLCGNTDGKCYKKHIKRCTTLWLKRYCEHKSFESCDGDFECMKEEILKCKKTLPKCFSDRSLCCDHNKCTTDVCHPKSGCVNVPKDCNDNNLCTVDTCDAKKGCVHTEIKCDDGIECTIDTCNYKTGKCEHQTDHAKCSSEDICKTGVCDSKKGCIYREQKDTDKCPPPTCDEICSGQCKASGPCETVSCTCDKNLKAVCSRKQKDCDDGKKCTLDYCDVSTGKCVHKCIKSEECGDCTVCDKNQDCASFAERNKLFPDCKAAKCDTKLGVCVAFEIANCCPKSVCDGLCKSKSACNIGCSCSKNEKGVCVARYGDGLATNHPCHDGNVCTKDYCNEKTGSCVHETLKGCCQKDVDCTEFGKNEKVAQNCQEAYCDKKTHKCAKRDLPTKPFCQPKCELECIAQNKCEEAKCVPAENGWACQRTKKSCDDANHCTYDYCDLETGNCRHKSVECDCNGITCKPKDKCHTAKCIGTQCVQSDKQISCDDHNDCTDDSCDAKLGCVHKLRDDCFDCKKKCAPRHKCETASCEANPAGKGFKCVYNTISCKDGDKCTIDYCDVTKGQCVHTAKDKPECHKNCEEECGFCQKCVKSSEGKWTCAASDLACNDNDECTVDICDSEKRRCTNKLIDKPECHPCTEDDDCKHNQFKLKNACTAFGAIGVGIGKCGPKGYCSFSQKGCCNLKNCVAKNACESAFCVQDELGRNVCKRVVKSCDDGIDCTRDYCDTKSGKCLHIAVNCCSTDKDCSAIDSKVQKLCKRATCDLKSRRCKIVTDKSKVCCPIECSTTNPCETAECVFDANLKPVCLHNKLSCDDGDKCTADTCDAQKGCVHTKIDNCCSKSDKECADWGKKHRLSECFEARCDIERGRCTKVLISNPPTKCNVTQCNIDCSTTNPCETAECVPDSEIAGKFVCEVKQINCNDNNICTVDSCVNGQCVNKKIDSPECHCNKNTDCPAAKTSCQESYCDVATNTCVVRSVPNAPGCVCDLDCVAPSPCQKAWCDFDENNKPYCKVSNSSVISCNDNNSCTKDYYNVLTCDCVHESIYDERVCHGCEANVDCLKWGNDQNLYSLCKTAVCDTERGVCVAKDIADKSRCCAGCTPRNGCESANCVLDAHNKPVCKITRKNCDDGIDCTRDYCDTKSGKCVHTAQNCCSTDKDCSALDAKVQKSCKKAYCDLNRKTCRVEKDTSRVCCVGCVPSNKCETAECSLDKNNNSVCVRKQVSCDDGNNCTTDSCDADTGNCVHTPIPNKVCCPNAPNCSPPSLCDSDKVCANWADYVGLASSCKGSKCDLEQRICVTYDLVDQTNCPPPPPPPPKCNIDCTSTDPCQTAKCEPSSEIAGQYVCIRTNVSCDDGNNCTADSCNNGQCVNTPIDSPACHPCSKDSDCPALASACQVAYCEPTTGQCVVRDVPNAPGCNVVCDLDCVAPTRCQQSVCVFDSNNKPYCNVSYSVHCYDGDICTHDYCNAQTGDCEFVSIRSKECTPCTQTTDCVQWGIDQNLAAVCKQPKCVQLTNISTVCVAEDALDKSACGCPGCVSTACVDTKCIKSGNSYICQRTNKCDDGIACTTDSCQDGVCSHTPNNFGCNDNDNCTIDTCDATKGCVHTLVPNSALCVPCNTTNDCSHYALTHNLAKKCLEPVCNANKHCTYKPNPDCHVPCVCPTKNCFVSSCSFDENNKPVCSYTAKSCVDNVDCTIDTCDVNTGLCVHTPVDNTTKLCTSYLNCVSWFKDLTNVENKQCKTPVCTGGCCKVVVDNTKFPCNISCPADVKCSPSSVCERADCRLTANGVQCVSSPIPDVCNDGNNCTVDYCDAQKGCVHNYVPGPQCQCNEPQCKCTGTQCACSGPDCCHCEQPTNKCKISTKVTYPNGTCGCVLQDINCDDHINCTQDTCDSTTGTCKNVFVTSKDCTVPCTDNVQCFLWAHTKNLATNCQGSTCNKTLGACQAVDLPECHRQCKTCVAKNCGFTANCVKVGQSYQCIQTPVDCNDHKTCTTDSFDTKTCQCVHTFDSHCSQICNTPVDCDSWAITNHLSDNCSHAICDAISGSCQAVPDFDQSRCRSNCTNGDCNKSNCKNGICGIPCNYTSDCPQQGFGSVCFNGSCVANNCTNSYDCSSSSVPGELICSCVPNTTTGASQCVCNQCNAQTKNCTCDDKNVCTRDVYLPEYNFCEHFPRCDDQNACTNDLCIPSADGKSYTCSHVTKSCSLNCTLAGIPAANITEDLLPLWVGKCDKITGCHTCCGTGQCDDHNGCTFDSCINQQCQNAPIDNQWCDPKIADQPINYQSIPGLRDQLALAGYDIAKLGE